jgi:hypothetical protein
MKRLIAAVLGIMAMVLASSGAVAQEAPAVDAAPAAPAVQVPDAAPAAGQPVEAVIVAIEGLAMVRDGEDQPWRKAEPQMQVGAGAEFRTGPRSSLQFRMPPDQVVTIGSLSTVTLLRALQEGSTVTTDLGMKYGRTAYTVEEAGVTHQATIRTPSTTMAVRGTENIFAEDRSRAFLPRVGTFNTRAFVRKRGTQFSQGIGGPGQGQAETNAGETVAGGALDQTGLNPTGTELTGDEERLINQFQSLGGFLTGVFSNQGGNFRQLDLGGALPNLPTNGGTIVPPEELIGDITTMLALFAVRILDNGAEDGDRVRVEFNNSVLQQDLMLTNAGTVFNLNLHPGQNVFSAIDIFTPEGDGRVLTGEVVAPDGSSNRFDFSMNALGEKRSLVIVRSPGSPGDTTSAITSPMP